jgi:hypothetical protein
MHRSDSPTPSRRQAAPAVAVLLGKLIRLLSSDREGEVAAAARQIMRALEGVGTNIHELADIVERGVTNGAKTFSNRNTATAPNHWHRVAQECLDVACFHNQREHDFTKGMRDLTENGGIPSEAQCAWLLKIHRRIHRR